MKSIFISSTFRDMQAERDALALYVLPEIAKLAQEHFDDIDFIDLRWGVDTSELDTAACAEKVLSVCLDEIDRSNPYMIIILGERYGWIPDTVTLHKTIEDKGYLIDDDFKSITALEIEYGALSAHGKLDHCLFYAREGLDTSVMPEAAAHLFRAETTHHKTKLDQLKNKIAQNLGHPIKTYTVRYDSTTGEISGLEHFCAIVLNDLRQLMAKEWDESLQLPWQEKAIRSARAYMEHKARQFTALFELCDNYEKMLYQSSVGIFIITGEHGSGKSTILAQMYNNLQSKGVTVAPFVCGITTDSSTTTDLLKQLVYFMTKLLDLPLEDLDMSFSAWRREFTRLGKIYETTRPNLSLVIMIDGLELLSGPGAQSFDWLPDILPANIKVVSCCASDTLIRTPLRLKDRLMTVSRESLDTSEKQAIINELLKSRHKQLSSLILDHILNLRSSASPFFISLLVERLSMLNRHDFAKIAELGNDMPAINAYLLDIVDKTPDDPKQMCAAFLSAAGNDIDSELVSRTIQLLAGSTRGLRERDIKAIFKRNGEHFNALSFSQMLKYLHGFFIIRNDGRIDFSHVIIRKAILDSMAPIQLKVVTQQLLAYVRGLTINDPLQTDEIISLGFGDRNAAVLFAYISALTTAAKPTIDSALQELVRILTIKGGADYHWFLTMLNDQSSGEAQSIAIKLLAAHIYHYFPGNVESLSKQCELYTLLTAQLEAMYIKQQVDLFELLSAKFQLASALDNRAVYNDALKLYQSCSEILDQDLTDDIKLRVLHVQILNKLALIYHKHRQIDMMMDSSLQAVALAARNATLQPLFARQQDLAASKEMLADAYLANDTFLPARRELDEAVAIREALLEDHTSAFAKRNLAIAYEHLAYLYISFGNNDKRIAYCLKALTLREEAAAEIRSYSMLRELAISYNNLCIAELAAGHITRAEAYLHKALPLYQTILEATQTSTAKEDRAAVMLNAALLEIRKYNLQAARENAADGKRLLMELLANNRLERLEVRVKIFDRILAADPQAANTFVDDMLAVIHKNGTSAYNELLTEANTVLVKAEKAAVEQAEIFYSEGLALLSAAVEMDPTIEHRDLLASWYNTAAIRLKKCAPKIKQKYWEQCCAIWSDIYLNTTDLNVKKAFKKKYLYTKLLDKGGR